MLPQPKPGPDPSEPVSSSASPLPTAEDDAGSDAGFVELVDRFSARSGGGLSPDLAADLALEIVLNEIVEQACLATGATGAAIVLKRAGEMVCRAASGPTAPELGSLLDTSSGVSGECVRTLHTQRCDDVLTNNRADVEASRRLGVRSLMVMPLVRGNELLGVFELFSSRACAFGDRDERTLEALATRALASMERATQPPPPVDLVRFSGSSERVIPGGESPTPSHEVEPVAIASEIEPPAIHSEISAQSTEDAATGDEIPVDSAERAAHTGIDLLTVVLAVAVLACATLLGVLVGRHLGAPRAKVRAPAAISPATASASPATNTSASAVPANKTEGTAGTTTQSAPKPRGNDAVPPGGLLVSQNGKEIFRLPPTPGEAGSAAVADHEVGMQRASALVTNKNEPREAVEISPAEAEGSLLSRVEPDYPEDARQQQIQGAVVLKVRIGVEGTVENVQVVSGPPQLIPAASAAVAQWRYKPHKENGQAVPAQTLVTLNFRLPQ